MRLIDAEGLEISIAKKIKVDSYEKDDVINGVLQIIAEQPTVPAFGKWNKLTFRLPTEEEKKDYPDWIFFIEGLPSYGELVLVTDGKRVWKDCFHVCDGFGFYGNKGDIYLDSWDEVTNVIAWMPLPEPPKGGTIDEL